MYKKQIIKPVCIMLVLFLLVSALLTACGQPQKEKSASGQETNQQTAKSDGGSDASAQKSEVTYWYPHGNVTDQNALKKAIEQFNNENADIMITGEFVGGSGSGQGITDKLTVAINGGNPPDIVLFDRFMVGQWADAGLFEDLTQIAESNGISKDMFYDFAWQEANYQGKFYAFPFDTDNRVLFYNKKMFRDAGLDPEKPPLTIEELDKYAEKLTVKEGNRYSVIGFIPWLSQGWLYTWGWSFGGQFYDKASGKITANDPAIVKALEWETTYAEKYNIEAVTNFSNASGGDVNPFAAGMVAMMVSGPWEISGFKDTAPDLEYGVSYVPTPTGTDFKSWAGGWSHIIPKGAKNIEAAAEFGKFMTIGDGARIYGEDTTHFMTFKELNENFSWVKNDPRFEIFVELFPSSYCRPPIPKGQLLWDELATATDNALHGKGTSKELLDAVTDKVNKELGF